MSALSSGPVGDYVPCRTADDLAEFAEGIAASVDYLWPDQTMDERCMALAEEAGEVCRAALKRNHVRKYGGLFKGKNEADWTDNLRVELGQLIGVALDIAHREGIDVWREICEVDSVLADMADAKHKATQNASSPTDNGGPTPTPEDA